MRVAAGAIARKYLYEQLGIEIQGWLAQLGPIRTDNVMDMDSIEDNPFFSPDASVIGQLEDYMDSLRKSGDSVGARYQPWHGMYRPVWVSRFTASWMLTWQRR